MSTISISSNFQKHLLYTMFTYNPRVGSINNSSSSSYSFGDGDSFYNNAYYVRKTTFSIMKGVVPTDFSALTLPTSRSSDVLLTMQDSTDVATIGLTNPFTDTPGEVSVNSQFITASASGEATWFWWYITGYSDGAIKQQLVGTIGTTGTDLVIPNTSIVGGERYKFTGLRFTLPKTFNY